MLEEMWNFGMILGVIIAACPPNDRRLVVLGEFFIDLISYNVPKLPQMGLEVRTDFLSE
jgi:hypothetical protein